MIKIKLIIYTLLFFLFSCAPEAPHDNSLDPYHSSIGNSGIGLIGEVLSKAEPHVPISNCLVLIMPEQYYDTTNIDGRFQFSNLQTGVHQIIIEKAGFKSDTSILAPDTVSSNPMHFYLNGLPFITETKIYSEYIDQWWPDPVANIKFEIIANDPDGAGDIKIITLDVPEMGISKEFTRTVKQDSFFLQLSEPDFPQDSLPQLIGKEMQIVLQDNSNKRVTESPFYLIRIIDFAPIPVEPVGLQTVVPKPLFQWQPYIASFVFNYEVSVFVVAAGLPVLIHNQKNVSVNQTEYQYPDSLSTGTYFWTVGVRDEIGNLSRSKEASFIVP